MDSYSFTTKLVYTPAGWAPFSSPPNKHGEDDMDTTYVQLIEAHKERLLEEKGKLPTQVLKNHLSVLHSYLAFCGKSPENQVGREFSADHFKQRATEFIEAIANPNKKTSADKLSILRGWYKTVVYVLQLQRLKVAHGDSRFHKELRLAVAKSGQTIMEIARGAKCDHMFLRKWLNGAYPYKTGFPSFIRLEQYLGFERGYLDTLMPHPKKPNRLSPKPVLDDFSKRHRQNLKCHYFFPNKEFGPGMLAEWKQFVGYKVAECAVGLKRAKYGKWRVISRDEAVPNTVRNPLAQTANGMVCPSAERTSNFLRGYLGFLSKPSTDEVSPGLGLSRSDIQTLAMFAIPEFVNAYFEFIKQRSGNTVHSGHNVIAAFILSLTKKVEGYLWQQSMFIKKVEQFSNGRSWHELCEETSRLCMSWQEAAYGNKSRDPKVPLSGLLALDDPLAPFARAIRKLDEAAANRTPGTLAQAIYKRNALLMAIVVANPLRLRTLTITKYVPPDQESDYRSNLYRTESGQWRLRFMANEFKNGRARGKDYDAPLPAALAGRIEEYLYEWRPILMGESPAPWLFPNSMGHKHSNLGQVITFIAKNYIPEVPRLGGHMLRHIVATDFLKRNPGQYTVLAELLNDHLETVLKNYAHDKLETAFNAHEESLKGFLSRI